MVDKTPLPTDDAGDETPKAEKAVKKDEATKGQKLTEALRFKAPAPGVGAISGGELGDRRVRGHDILTEADLGAKAYAKASTRPWFEKVKIDAAGKVVGLLCLVVLLCSFASPAAANDKGTNFTYAEDIGWAGAHLDTLPTILAAQDTLFTGVRGAVHSPVADIAALKAIAATGATGRVDKMLCYVESASGGAKVLYVFDSGSSSAGDDDLIVQPTSGSGRWFRLNLPGDITGVTAGTGLTGGGSSGAVTLAIDSTVVTNTTGDAAAANYVMVSDGATKGIRSGGVLIDNFPTMPSAAVAGSKFILSNGANKALEASLLGPADFLALTGGTMTGSVTLSTSSATDDKLVLGITTGGAATFTGTLSPSELTAARVWRLPDADGTFAIAGAAPATHAASHTNGGDDIAVVVGDAGAGGTKGLVPAPAAGDAAAGKYLKANGTWTTPPGATQRTFAAASVTQSIGALTAHHTAASTGSVTVSGTPKRSGTLRIEITVSGEADAACRFKYSFQGEALSAEKVCTSGAGIALDSTGLTAIFENGAPLSFEDEDYWEGTATFTATANAETFALTADVVTPALAKESITITNSRVQVGSFLLCGATNTTATTGGGFCAPGPGAAGSIAIFLNNMDGGAAFNGQVVVTGDVINATAP